MTKIKLEDYSSLELGQMIKTKEISVVETVDAAFERIEESEKRCNCLVSTSREAALKQAALIQSQIDEGIDLGPVAGVPITVKDNICTKGIKTTCASKMLADFVPEFDATVVINMKQAGAIIVGKNNMDEFAMGSTSESSYFGEVSNPVNQDYVVGGSSGGSAASVKLGQCGMSVGSDTGGSIRLPSSFCGVTGIKPTYGTTSRYGLIAYASSFDQIGPIAKTVEECATYLQIMSSFDKRDATSMLRNSYDFTSQLRMGVKGMKVGIPTDFMAGVSDKNTDRAIKDVAALLESEGAIIEEFELGLSDYAVAAYYVIAAAEASSNLARFDGVKYGYRTPEYESLEEMYQKTMLEGFGTKVRRRIDFGKYCLGPDNYEKYYLQATKIRRMIANQYAKCFNQYDFVLSPVSPRSVPRKGEAAKDPIGMNQIDLCTVGANMVGIPGMSVPVSQDDNGLPLGVQLLANHWQENTLLRAGFVVENGMK